MRGTRWWCFLCHVSQVRQSKSLERGILLVCVLLSLKHAQQLRDAILSLSTGNFPSHKVPIQFPRFPPHAQVQLQDVPRDLISLEDLEGEPDPNPDIRNSEEEEMKRIQPANEYYDGENDNDRDAPVANLDDLVSVGASSRNVVVVANAAAAANGTQQQRAAGGGGAGTSSSAAAEVAVAATSSSSYAAGGTGGLIDASVVNASADSSNNETSEEPV